MRLGLDSIRTKKSCSGLTVQPFCTSPPAVRPQNATGSNERRGKMRITNTLSPAAAHFFCFWWFRKREKERQKGGKRAWQLSPLNSNSLESDCVWIFYAVVCRLSWGRDYKHPGESFSSGSSAAQEAAVPNTAARRVWVTLVTGCNVGFK